MRAHHRVMKTRGDIRAVIEGLQSERALLAAFLEATDRIDWRALNQRVVIGETPTRVNLEAREAPTLAKSVVSPFAFRRANLTLARLNNPTVEPSRVGVRDLRLGAPDPREHAD